MGIKRFEKKLDNKIKKLSFVKKNLLLIFFVFVLVSFMSIGYSALNQTLNITGDIVLRAVKDIRINDLKLTGNNKGNGYEKYNSKFTVDTINIFTGLTDIGDSVTYQATIKNKGNVDMEITSITGSLNHEDASYSISGLYKETLISAGTEKNFLIIVYRSQNSSSEIEEIEANLSLEIRWEQYTQKHLVYNIKGNTIQEGTPSPTTPIEMQSVGDRTVNLADISVIKTTTNVINNNNGTISVTADTTTSGVSDNKTTLGMLCPNIEVGKTYTLSLESTGKAKRIYLSKSKAVWEAGTSRTITEDDINSKVIWYANGDTDTTFTAVISDFQIQEGTIATDYEPYGKYKIPITVSSKNLIPYPYAHTTKTVNGIAFTDNGDGTVTANGTATANADFNFTGTFQIKEGMLISSGVTGDSSKTYEVFVNGMDGTILHSYSNKPADHDFEANRIFIRIRPGVTVNNLIFKPMLEFNSSATEYVPYVEPVTKNIYLDEPLRKVGTFADYIDYENNTVVRKVKKMVVDGGLKGYLHDWRHVDGYYAVGYKQSAISDIYSSNEVYSSNEAGYILCNKLVNKKYSALYSTTSPVEGISIGSASYSIFIRLKNEKITNETEYYEYLNSNPLDILYVLETPSPESNPIELPEFLKKPFYNNVTVETSIQPNLTYTWE